MPAESFPSYEDLVAENAALRAMVADLTAWLEQTMGRIADLEARSKQSSSKPSKPPSLDGLAKPAPKSFGSGPGRPTGQDGVILERFADPDVVIRHVPAVCAGCGSGLAGAAEVDMAWRQVVDVPPVQPHVTEHQLITLMGGCGLTPPRPLRRKRRRRSRTGPAGRDRGVPAASIAFAT